MPPLHRCLHVCGAASALAALLVLVLVLLLSAAAPPVGAQGASDAAPASPGASSVPALYTAAQRVNTRRFLMAFAGPDSPLHGVWGSGDFCDWPLITCAVGGVSIRGGDYVGPLVATVPLPEVPADVDAAEVVLTDLSSPVRCTRWAFGGTLPASWGRLPRLRVLHVDSGALSGTLPPEWSQMRALESLTLAFRCYWADFDALSGTLPAAWGSLASLRALNLRRNHLRGTLPAAWASLSPSVSVQLRENAFSGGVPVAWRERGFAVDVEVPWEDGGHAAGASDDRTAPHWAARWAAGAYLAAAVFAFLVCRRHGWLRRAPHVPARLANEETRDAGVCDAAVPPSKAAEREGLAEDQ